MTFRSTVELTLLDLTGLHKDCSIESASKEISTYLLAQQIEPSQVVISCEINSGIPFQNLKMIAASCGVKKPLVTWRLPLRRSIIRKSPQISEGLLELVRLHNESRRLIRVYCDEIDSRIKFDEVTSATEKRNIEEAWGEIPSLGLVEFNGNEMQELARSIAVAWPSSRKSRLFIDVSSIIKRDLGTGIQRVIRNLIPEIMKALPENYEFRLIAADENGGPFYFVDFTKRTSGDEITFTRNSEIVEFIQEDIFLGLDLNYGVTLSHSNYFLTLQRRGVKLAGLIYDLLPVQFPNFFPKEVAALKLHERYLQVLGTFDSIIAISKAVEDDYVEWIRGNSPTRLLQQTTGHIPLGSGLKVGHSSKGVSQYGNYFLHVGTIEPRKNILQILDAFEILWQDNSNCNLVLVGKPGWGMDETISRILSHVEIGKRLHWLQSANDSELSDLYSGASSIIMASSGEGYGLPIVEAHSFGKRVLARDIPVFREVCGPSDYFFEGESGYDLSLAINAILLDSGDGPARPSPTWKNSADSLLKYLFPSS